MYSIHKSIFIKKRYTMFSLNSVSKNILVDKRKTAEKIKFYVYCYSKFL